MQITILMFEAFITMHSNIAILLDKVWTLCDVSLFLTAHSYSNEQEKNTIVLQLVVIDVNFVKITYIVEVDMYTGAMNFVLDKTLRWMHLSCYQSHYNSNDNSSITKSKNSLMLNILVRIDWPPRSGGSTLNWIDFVDDHTLNSMFDKDWTVRHFDTSLKDRSSLLASQMKTRVTFVVRCLMWITRPLSIWICGVVCHGTVRRW